MGKLFATIFPDYYLVGIQALKRTDANIIYLVFTLQRNFFKYYISNNGGTKCLKSQECIKYEQEINILLELKFTITPQEYCFEVYITENKSL